MSNQVSEWARVYWACKHKATTCVCQGAHSLVRRARLPLASALAVTALLLTACSSSPNGSDQRPWLWQQGPGNAEKAEDRHSTEAPAPRNETQTLSAEQAITDTGVSSTSEGYTQAVRYGNQLYVSGQIPVKLGSLKLVGDSVEEQTEAVMNNVKTILNDHGMTMSNVLFVTLYLKEINDLGRVDNVYQKYFHRSLPARAVVEVSDLPRGSRLEIAVVAGR